MIADDPVDPRAPAAQQPAQALGGGPVVDGGIHVDAFQCLLDDGHPLGRDHPVVAVGEEFVLAQDRFAQRVVGLVAAHVVAGEEQQHAAPPLAELGAGQFLDDQLAGLVGSGVEEVGPSSSETRRRSAEPDVKAEADAERRRVDEKLWCTTSFRPPDVFLGEAGRSRWVGRALLPGRCYFWCTDAGTWRAPDASREEDPPAFGAAPPAAPEPDFSSEMIDSTDDFASPSSMSVLSLKNSGF